MVEIKQYLDGDFLPNKLKVDGWKDRFQVENGALYHMLKATSKKKLGKNIKQLVVPMSQRGGYSWLTMKIAIILDRYCQSV